MILKTKYYYLLTLLVIAIFLLMGVATLNDYGMGWDEITRWISGDTKLAYYKSLFSGESEAFRQILAGDRYPGLFDLPLALFHSVLGGNRMLQGHFLSICFGVIGLIATAWVALIVFNSRTSFFAALLLAIFPLFYGHAMINPKDIPFLATYTLGLAIILRICQLMEKKTPSLKWFVFCGMAIGMAASSRIPGMVLLGMGICSWGAVAAFRHWTSAEPAFPRQLVRNQVAGSLLVAAVAFCIVFLFFPRLHFQIFSGLPEVTSDLHTSANSMPLIYNGQIMNAAQGPLTYAHGFFVISTPVWMLVLLIGGLILQIRSLMLHYRSGDFGLLLRLLFFAFALFPWLYILATHPALHDGSRHMLFAMPPLVILMASFLDHFFSWTEQRSRLLSWVAGLSLTGCVLLQIIRLYTMHPYQYVSFNWLAGDKSTLPARYETEYWCTSSKHMLEMLPGLISQKEKQDAGSTPIKIRISGALNSARQFVPEGFQLVDTFEEADYYLANTYLMSDLYVEGEVLYTIRRGNIPIAVIKRLN